MSSAGISGRILVSYFSPPKRLETPGRLSIAEQPDRPKAMPSRAPAVMTRKTTRNGRMGADAAFGAVKSSCIRRNSSNEIQARVALKREGTSPSRSDSRLLRSSRPDVGDQLWRSRARFAEKRAFFSGVRRECHTGAAGLEYLQRGKRMGRT